MLSAPHRAASGSPGSALARAGTGISYLKSVVASAAALLALSSAVLATDAQAKAYQVIGTGGTLHVHSAPSLSAGVVGEMRDGTWIDITCQTAAGDTVVGSSVWDKIDSPYAGYVADWFTTTPAVGKYTEGLPICGGATPSQSSPVSTPQSSPQYRQLRNRASVRCLDADRGTIGSNGTKVQLWDCWGGSNQNWLIGADGTIRNQASGRCLDADTSTIGANGSKVQLWDCTGQANQRWTIEANGTIRNQASGRALDANAGTLNANGTKVQLWDAWGGRNQSWYSASPAALPQTTKDKYCWANTRPISGRGTGIAFAPCLSVTDVYDGTSTAPRSIQGSGCTDGSFVAEAMTCTVTSTGSRWNGSANVDYMTLKALWDGEVVIVGYQGQTFTTTTLEEDLITVEIVTPPNGYPAPHKTGAVTSLEGIAS